MLISSGDKATMEEQPSHLPIRAMERSERSTTAPLYRVLRAPRRLVGPTNLGARARSVGRNAVGRKTERARRKAESSGGNAERVRRDAVGRDAVGRNAECARGNTERARWKGLGERERQTQTRVRSVDDILLRHERVGVGVRFVQGERERQARGGLSRDAERRGERQSGEGVGMDVRSVLRGRRSLTTYDGC